MHEFQSAKKLVQEELVMIRRQIIIGFNDLQKQPRLVLDAAMSGSAHTHDVSFTLSPYVLTSQNFDDLTENVVLHI